MIETVLLPFANKIIYDGLLAHYSIHFGSNISGRLKDVYLMAKNNGAIIESLTAEPKIQVMPKMTKNWVEQSQLPQPVSRSTLNHSRPLWCRWVAYRTGFPTTP